MDEGDVRFLAKVWANVADLEAVKTRVKGMEADNLRYISLGDSPRYGEDLFESAASEIEAIATTLRGL